MLNDDSWKPSSSHVVWMALRLCPALGDPSARDLRELFVLSTYL